ncbi:MAG: hypothetical protein Q7U04_03170, partial [Bacteriovorax sp.]|nr:hypothetical protein [Bacteriovorax sp.]
MNGPFKIYFLVLLLLALIGLKSTSPFMGTRMIASDCSELVTSIIKTKSQNILNIENNPEMAKELNHYNFKNYLWKKITNISEFENFHELEYQRLLEIYKNSEKPELDLLLVNPVSIEQKLALIEAIELKFTHFQNLPSIQFEIKNLSIQKLGSLQKLMKKFDLSSELTRTNIQEFASDFFFILRGPPNKLLDYFSKNKTAKTNARMIRALEEDMLAYGLRGSIESIALKEQSSQLEKAHLFIDKFLKYKIVRFFPSLYDLPKFKNVQIPDELIEKILMDGLNEHQSELITALKKQNLLDHYENFKKVY